MAEYDEVWLRTVVYEHFPGKTVVDISEVENAQHQTYRYLYDELCARLAQSEEAQNEMKAELFSQKADLDDLSRENCELRNKVSVLQALNGNLENTASELTALIENFLSGDIYISNPVPCAPNGEEILMGSDNRSNCISDMSKSQPAVYQGRRPGWFSPLGRELEKNNIVRKNVAHTEGMLKELTIFWNRMMERLRKGHEDIKVLVEEADIKRRNDIERLLAENISNEEKFIKYLMVTPGIPHDYLKTLIGASELGIDAGVAIRFLEQPTELFHREIFETYVSKVHKGTEYNLKRELAEELVRGEWYVRADVNGIATKFRLVPFDMICEIKDTFDTICRLLKGVQDMPVSDRDKNHGDGELCAGMAQSETADMEGNFCSEEEELENVSVDEDEFMETIFNG